MCVLNALSSFSCLLQAQWAVRPNPPNPPPVYGPGDVLIILLITIISQHLLMSGDIETNPGPRRGGEYTHVLAVIWLSCVALYPHLS